MEYCVFRTPPIVTAGCRAGPSRRCRSTREGVGLCVDALGVHPIADARSGERGHQPGSRDSGADVLQARCVEWACSTNGQRFGLVDPELPVEPLAAPVEADPPIPALVGEGGLMVIRTMLPSEVLAWTR